MLRDIAVHLHQHAGINAAFVEQPAEIELIAHHQSDCGDRIDRPTDKGEERGEPGAYPGAFEQLLQQQPEQEDDDNIGRDHRALDIAVQRRTGTGQQIEEPIIMEPSEASEDIGQRKAEIGRRIGMAEMLEPVGIVPGAVD